MWVLGKGSNSRVQNPHLGAQGKVWEIHLEKSNVINTFS